MIDPEQTSHTQFAIVILLEHMGTRNRQLILTVPIVINVRHTHIYFRVPIKIGDVPKSPFAKNSGIGAIGRHNKTSNWLRSAWVPKEPASMWLRALIVARVRPAIERRES